MLPDHRYSGQRFRRAIRAFLLGRAVQGIANLALTLWVVRLLAPKDYGAYMALWGIVEMLVPLSSLGLLEAVRRFLPGLVAQGTAAGVRLFVKWTTLARLAILLAWAAAIGFSWSTVSGWVGFDSQQRDQTWPVVFLILAVLAYRYACEMLECLLEQRWSQVAHALHPIGRLFGVAALLATDNLSLASVLWVDVAVSASCLVVAEWALTRKLATLEGQGVATVSGREVFLFSWHLAGANLLQSMAGVGAQRLLAARLLGLEAAGLFAFLQQQLVIVSRYMPAQLLANIVRPMLISRHLAGEPDVVSKSFALMWKSNLLIVLSCVTALAVLGNELVAWISGGRFIDAGPVTLVLFVGLGATSQGLLISMAMQIHDQSQALRNQSILLLLVPLAAWAGSSQGMFGLVSAVVLVQWARNAFALWWMRRHGVALELDVLGVLRLGGWALLAIGLGWWCKTHFGPWPALVAITGMLLAGLLLVKPLSRVDFELLGRATRGKAHLLRPLVWNLS